jgi:hypothetical protein
LAYLSPWYGSMLSLQECRKILGPSCSLDDNDIALLRDSYYSLADVILSSYRKKQKTPPKTTPYPKTKPSFENMLKLLSEAEREEVIERAGIMEYDGQLPREKAEEIALSKFFNKDGKRN